MGTRRIDSERRTGAAAGLSVWGRLAIAGLCVAVMVIAGGCGDDDSGASASATTPQQSSPEQTATPQPEPTTSPSDDDNSGDSATTIPLTGADGDAAAQEAFTIVASAFEAYNSGDMDTWAIWREGGPDTGADFDYDLASQGRLDVEHCAYRGLAEWLFDGRVKGHGFDCAVTQSDVFLRAAGIELEMTYNWVVDEDLGSSIAGSNEDFETVEELMGSYREWLAANYPDVEASIEYDSSPRTAFPTAEGVPAAAEYIDEFVAGSDIYPFTEPVPAGNYGGPLEQIG